MQGMLISPPRLASKPILASILKAMKALLPVFAIFALSSSSLAQSIIQNATTGDNPSTIRALAPTGGGTENLSVTNGSRTSLSVGNSTSFGASTNLSLSAGLVGVGRSTLIPATTTVTSNIGTTGTKVGITTINISNLTAKGGGTVNPNKTEGIGDGTTIESNDGQFASGDATIDGMSATVSMTIDPNVKVGDVNSQASFYSIVHPNLTSASAACEPSAGKPCAYVTQDALVSGNAAASANLATQTNIDIQASSFTQTFAQSF
jgi:hypothetical protein